MDILRFNRVGRGFVVIDEVDFMGSYFAFIRQYKTKGKINICIV